MTAVLRLLWPRVRGLRNRWGRASPSERATWALFGAVGLVFWAGIFALFIWLVGRFYEVEVFGPILCRKLMELMLVGLFGLLCFSNVITGLSTFYLSNDLDLLLSLPISRPVFHFARFTETVVQSSWMILLFGLPIFVAYGLAYHAPWTWYPLLAGVVVPFVLIPAAIGITIAGLLVSFFPARRIREGLVLLGVLSLAFIFVLLRLVGPEQFADVEGFQSVAAYVAQLQSPAPMLLPPRWTSDVVMSGLIGQPLPWLELGLLVTGAIASVAVGRWITAAVYDGGRSKAQQARPARLARAGWLDRLTLAWSRPLPPLARAVVLKDVRTFFRDAAQWSQLFLVGSIVVIAVASVALLPLDIVRGPWEGVFRNALTYLVLGMVGIVMAAVATRFQFTATSAEGRAFWIVRTAPITPEAFLWAKLWPGLLPMLFVGEVTAVASAWVLGAGPFLIGVSMGTGLVLALGISGLAVAMGALWPNFKADDAARVAAGPSGVLFMLAAIGLVGIVVGLEAIPVYVVLRAQFEHRAISTMGWLGGGLALFAAVAVSVAAAVWPVKVAARRLWERELPNG